MANQPITHILPIFPTPLPGQKPEDHLRSYHLNVSDSVTKLFQKILDLEDQVRVLQAQKKGGV